LPQRHLYCLCLAHRSILLLSHPISLFPHTHPRFSRMAPTTGAFGPLVADVAAVAGLSTAVFYEMLLPSLLQHCSSKDARQAEMYGFGVCFWLVSSSRVLFPTPGIDFTSFSGDTERGRGGVITTIFPRIYARTYYAQPRARVMSKTLSQFARSVNLLQPNTPSSS
jgi:hypothetical protein